jgi:hypothetical protein
MQVPMAVPLLGILIGSLFVVAGALLVFKPDQFLAFYDFLNPGMRWNKTAEWRRNIQSAESKIVGVVFLVAGLFFVVRLLRIVLSKSG